MMFAKNRAITKLTVVLTVVIIILAATVGYLGYKISVAPAPTPPIEEILVGTSQPLTGAYAEDGKNIYLGIMLAQEYINEIKGGVYVEALKKKLPIRIIAYDDRSDPTRAKSIGERLIKIDKVHAIITPYSGLLTLPIIPMGEEAKIPMMIPVAWAESIYNKGYKYIFNPYVTTIKEAEIFIEQFKEVAKSIPIKTLAFVYSDDSYSTEVCETMAKLAPEAGFEVVLQEKFPIALLDYSAILLKIKALNPDFVIFYSLAAAGNVKFLKQIKELNIKPKLIYGGIFGDIVSVRNEVGADLENVIGHAHDLPMPVPGGEECYTWINDQIVNRKLLPWPESSLIMSGAECILVLADAIERAGTLDGEKIRDALAATDGVFIGPVKFDNRGVNSKRILFLVQFQDGDWRLISPSIYPGLGLQLPVRPVRPYS
jgi:branched-chain amino acid transport system substrate-binding protein